MLNYITIYLICGKLFVINVIIAWYACYNVLHPDNLKHVGPVLNGNS